MRATYSLEESSVVSSNTVPPEDNSKSLVQKDTVIETSIPTKQIQVTLLMTYLSDQTFANYSQRGLAQKAKWLFLIQSLFQTVYKCLSPK